ncbi:hypothetical protein PIB30_101834 [Stylosanthes scabra]|uniref:Uncharacterized protein n=1 Tax=Stylosanthes scabra TaxID=79078 RepID=A0ABU6TX09_9FABA|nr:hypothetical protein [Stylosanthes scabra]
MDTALLLYTLMNGGRIHLGRILNKSMYQATTGAKDKRLAFPKIKKKARKPDLPQAVPPPIPPPIHEPQEQPATSSAAAAQLAPLTPTQALSWTNLFNKLLKKLRRRKKELRNTQYMIRTANPGMEFPALILVSSSDSDNEDYG